MSLLESEIIHLTITALLAVLIYIKFKSAKLVVLCFIVGMLIDLDHLFDYFLFNNFCCFDFQEFLSGVYFGESGKCYIPLHGYEYVILSGFLAYKFKRYSSIFITIGLAMFGHLLVDQFTISENALDNPVLTVGWVVSDLIG